MSRSLSNKATTSIYMPSTDEVWLVLVSIAHASLAQTLYFVNNKTDVVSNGITYTAFPFAIELPGEDGDKPMLARLTIDAVDQQVINAVRSISSAPDVTIKVILASQPDTIEAMYTGLKLRNVEYDMHTIRGDLVFENILTEPVSISMTPPLFPGMF